jgi:hypothetical protein
MPSIAEGNLTFEFPAGWEVSKLDEWSFYRKQFLSIGNGTKAIDVLAVEPGRTCAWLIEIKDYRQAPRTKTLEIADEIAIKVRDSLALLAAARVNATDGDQKAIANRALNARSLRVVLHLEQRVKPSRLFPREIDEANVQQKLRQRVKTIDPHPMVRERAVMAGCPWTVR